MEENLSINTTNLLISDGAQLQSSNRGGQGDAGSIAVQASTIELVGGSETLPSAIASTIELGAMGNGGDLSVTTNSLLISEGAQLQTTIRGSTGNAGALSVIANTIELTGTAPPTAGNNNVLPSAILATIETDGIGNGNSVSIKTDSLTLREGAQIQSSNLGGRGNAGSLQVQARTIELSGTSIPVAGSDEILPSGIFASVEPEAVGNGGNLRVETDSLRVENGAQIATTTGGNGDAGDVTVIAQNIELSGTGPITSSGLLANATNNSPGKGGDIVVSSDQLTLKDGATLTVSNFASLDPNIPPGQGPAGNITVEANNLLLDGSIITADTVTGNNANITLNVTEAIALKNNAEITTDALGDRNWRKYCAEY